MMPDIFLGEPRYINNQINVASANFREFRWCSPIVSWGVRVASPFEMERGRVRDAEAHVSLKEK